MTFHQCCDRYVQLLGPHPVPHVCVIRVGHDDGHLCRCGAMWTEKMKREAA